MRLTLIDVLLGLVMLVPCVLVPSVIPEAPLLGLALGAGVGVWGGSWFYGRLGILPMLLPRCPCCQRRDEFLVVDQSGARWRMVCLSCRQAFVYWVSSPSAEYIPGALAEVQVGFPYFLGPTQVIWQGDSSIEQGGDLTGESSCIQVCAENGVFCVEAVALPMARPGCNVVQTEAGVTVKCQTAQASLCSERIEIEIYESVCAVTNALTSLQVRSWLEMLERSFGPLRISAGGQPSDGN